MAALVHVRTPVTVMVLAVMAGCASGDNGNGGATQALVVSPDSTTIAIGTTTQLTAADPTGQAVIGLSWISSDPATVAVSTAGVATAVAPGRVIVSASANGKVGTAVVRAALAKNFSVEAQITQGIQSADGSIPVVLGGGAAVVNVLVRTSAPGAEPMQLILRLFNAGNSLIRADTITHVGTLSTAPTYTTPSTQFLIPATLLPNIASWQVVRDPGGHAPDLDPTDDVYPRTGKAALVKVSVPSLSVHFVPIVLTSNGNATGQVTVAQLPAYLHTVKSVHPLGAITATVGTPFSTAANFGTPPSGGGAAFWQQVLAELDLARVSDVSGDPNSYWMGILVPPPGFNFTAYGGFGYIPGSGATRSAGTRTAIGVQLGWFQNQFLARDNIAHELGHNFGRAHAPCGEAGAPDPAFPNAGGVIGTIGHDVFSWANGEATAAVALPAQTGDLMGYCSPVWISEYTYRNVLSFRGSTAASLQKPAVPVRALVIRGRIEDNRAVLEPAFTIVARPAAPERSGSYRLLGKSQGGQVLFQYAFEPATLDHSSNTRHFLFAIPMSAAMQDSLVTIEVSGPGGVAQLRGTASPLLRTSQNPQATAGSNGSGGTTISCPDRSARGIFASDAATGAMVGTAVASSLRVGSGSPMQLRVQCSDGVRSTESLVAVP